MAAPQTGLTSCQIGDIGYPRTVHGNSRHIPGGPGTNAIQWSPSNQEILKLGHLNK